MPGLRAHAIRWYRKVFAAPTGSDIRDEGLDTVLDGNSAVALSEAGLASHLAQNAEGPRGIVASATGLALAGRRATAFVTGPDIAAAQDLLISAAGKHAPLVLHLAARATAAHGSAPGSSHDTVHLSADAGFFVMFAANVQEAVDFTYIARRVAEEALVPGIVVMDGEQTALAPQDVRLLSPAQIDSLVGSAREQIEAPTAAQKLLFGDTRRRVPAWHDLNEPVLSGTLFDQQSFALGALARRPYFDAFVGESMATAFTTFEAKTGRRYGRVSRHKLDDAQTVLLAQGAGIETARLAADHLRQQHKLRVGVLGIHALRPFPGEEITAALKGCGNVFVLERVDTPLSAEPPLTREVRASLKSSGNSHLPQCRSVVYGLGGLPLRVADLIELCTSTDSRPKEPLFLGVSFDDTSGEQPKREVLLDALRRAYPGAASMGVRAENDSTGSRQPNSLTIAIQRNSGGHGKDILGTAGALLRSLEGGRIRSRPAVAWEHWSKPLVDWLTHGEGSLQDPGDALVADVALDVPSGAVIPLGESHAYRADTDTQLPDQESLLGALFGVLKSTGRIEQNTRRIIAARRNLLEELDDRQRDALMASFQAGFENVVKVDHDEAVAIATVRSKQWEGETPVAVSHMGRDDDHYASLPRFWDQLGVLHRDGMSDRMTAGPYLASGTMPPLSSTFSDHSNARRMLPEFDPALCTGCGKCWTHCPDSAIGVVATAPAALIDAGISRTGAEAVRQVAPKLAARIISESKRAASPVIGDKSITFGDLLETSYAWIKDKMSLPEERRQAIEDGIDNIVADMGALPVAVTKPFFLDAEARKKDSAELLSVTINPDACKACGICINSCESEALRAREQDTAVLTQARKLWSTWAGTPDTSSETIERIAGDPDIGTMAAILLSRYCQFALAGGDPAEAGSGEKMAVRLALSATEFHQQPLVQRFAQTLLEAGEGVSALIRKTLSGTLAVDDLDAVTAQLKQTTSPRVDLKTLAEGAGRATGDHSIDTGYVLRLIELANEITAAHHRLVQGEHGLGRARYGLTVAGGSTASWAGAFPDNPFQAPVLIDMSGDAAQLAAGLIEGHLQETTELVRLLRLAQLEIEQPDGADWKREALASLGWKDLSDEEYELCPPLLLVGSDEMLAGRGLGQLMWLLNSGLPVQVLVLNALDFGLARDLGDDITPAPVNNPRGSLGLLALAQREAYVAQTSVADPVHLGESMLQALAHDGPALIQVYAPSPTRHGFRSEESPEQARLAVTSRAMPLFRYDPASEGVFGLRISLDGNPAVGETLVAQAEQARTPADWALGQQRFASNFQPLAADAATPTPLHEWLKLDTRKRAKQTPFVAVGNGDEERRYSITPDLINMTEQCLEAWQTLQELAGVVTPFTERLEQEIRAEVATEHQAELDAQSEAAEARVREMQQKTELEIASKIRSRLMDLASKKRS